MSLKDMTNCVPFIKDRRLSDCMYKFTNSINKDKPMDWESWNNTSSFVPDNGDYSDGSYNPKSMPFSETYQDYIINQRFEDVLDDFISGLLDMNSDQKSDFLKTLENMMAPLKPKGTKKDLDNIYNIVNKIYYEHSENDIFNSIKVSFLEKTKTVALSSYNLSSIENIKLKLIKEGIGNIRYRIIENPYNNKQIHTIMYERLGEK